MIPKTNKKSIRKMMRARNDKSETVEAFAISLMNKLREFGFRVRDPRDLRYGTIGFHLAGFVEHEGRKVPILYHIHNGISENYDDIDPYIVNANLDWTPEKILKKWSEGGFGGLRNGDFQPYAILSAYLSEFFGVLRENIRIKGEPFQIPFPNDNLDSWAEFLRFEIRLVSEIYALSSHSSTLPNNSKTLKLK